MVWMIVFILGSCIWCFWAGFRIGRQEGYLSRIVEEMQEAAHGCE